MHMCSTQIAKCTEDADAAKLFTRLYRCWAHHPIALLALCLLARAYEHAASLVQHFGAFDVTVDTLTETDQLIQLIESPIFACACSISGRLLRLINAIHRPIAVVRRDLLADAHRTPLTTVLYSLLMLMPQTEAFHMLHRRLQCVPPAGAVLGAPTSSPGGDKKNKR